MNYFGRKEISNSDLGNIKKSYTHYLDSKENKSKPTDAMKFGTKVHEYILERELFNTKYINDSLRPDPTKDYKTKINREWKKEQIEKGIEFITTPELELIEKMNNNFNVWNDKIDMDSENVLFEQEIYFTLNGVECRLKADIIDLDNNVIYDLKTSLDTYSEKKLTSTITNFAYYRQASFYKIGVSKKYNRKFDFEFIFLDKSGIGVQGVVLEDQFLNYGLNEAQYLLEIYKKALTSDNKNVYPNKTIEIEIPKWI